MDLVHEMEEGEGVDLAGPGCCPTDINPSDGSIFTEDDCTTRQGLEVTGMPYLNPWNISDGIKPFHLQESYQKEGGVSMIPGHFVELPGDLTFG